LYRYNEEMKKLTEAQKRSKERALRGQVKKKKVAPKLYGGKDASGNSRQENEEDAMAIKMQREARRRSMAYADGVGANELDEKGYPISFVKGVNVDEFLSQTPGNRAPGGAAEEGDAEGGGGGGGGGGDDPDGGGESDLGYASNGGAVQVACNLTHSLKPAW
jgi:hypothetical protein